MITEAQFLEQEQNTRYFQRGRYRESLAASQENNAKAKDLDSEDLRRIERIVES